jgi:serine/threonine protein kinase
MYLAPELAKGAMEARPPSDIFSFGVVAYELLCGELPYSQPPIVSRFRGEPIVVPALQKAHPEIPGWLAQLVARCLHPDPSRRPAASDVLAAFDAAR